MGNGTEVKPTVLQELFMLGRKAAVEKANLIFDGKIKEACFRTRYPRELKPFITACLALRGELTEGAGSRTLFLRDKASWQQVSETEKSPHILIADAELDFELNRSELLKQARTNGHSSVYAATSPRPDVPEIVNLPQAQKFEVEELLKKHRFTAGQAATLAQQSNGEAYLLSQLLAGTSERREWAKGQVGYQLRHLALLGGWNDNYVPDTEAVTAIAGEPYDSWIGKVYPFSRESEPPIMLEGGAFRPVSRYETWQQLGSYLTDSDLTRFKDATLQILGKTDTRLNLPKERRLYAPMADDGNAIPSPLLRSGLAETLTLLAGQKNSLKTRVGLAEYVAESVVVELLRPLNWQSWATLSNLMPALAEAAPDEFLGAVDRALNAETSPIEALFGQSEDPLFGRTYHTGLLWALEVLAWHPDYLSRVTLLLARMTPFRLPHNMVNNALNSLRSIFLTWFPQTLASVEQRHAAVKKLLEEHPDTGWRLLMAILPESHQTSTSNPKPAWRDWFGKEWTGQVTRHEMARQVMNYAQLAVTCAVGNTDKVTELLKRWDHLPREAVDQILSFLTSSSFTDRADEERFPIWEQLVNEVQKHHTHSTADWAMPEEELRRLADAAKVIEPKSSVVRNQRLFDDYAHHFFETSNYEAEERKLRETRELAVREMVAEVGLSGVINVAGRVKMPGDLGEALGRIGSAETDRELLPNKLLEENRAIARFIHGYAWARYFSAGAQWLDSFDTAQWSVPQQAKFFALLPFQSAVWRRAESILKAKTMEYWRQIYPNVFQARADLKEAVEKAIEYRRGDIAVSGINAMRFNKEEVPASLALAAVQALLADYKKGDHIEQHELLEAIKLLQKATDVDIEAVSTIEFQTLNLLEPFSGGSPVILERRLATDPTFFHNLVTRAFRSEKTIEQKQAETSSARDEMAGHIFKLLYHWHTPPGKVSNEALDEGSLTSWMNEVERLCKESGHWKIAQQLVGSSFVSSPLGTEGLLKYRAAAKILDRSDTDDMRRGFTTALFNLRGVHSYTAGKEELELAESYHKSADRFDVEGFTRIATSLRSLSESYRRESEREAKNNPYTDK